MDESGKHRPNGLFDYYWAYMIVWNVIEAVEQVFVGTCRCRPNRRIFQKKWVSSILGILQKSANPVPCPRVCHIHAVADELEFPNCSRPQRPGWRANCFRRSYPFSLLYCSCFVSSPFLLHVFFLTGEVVLLYVDITRAFAAPFQQMLY